MKALVSIIYQCFLYKCEYDFMDKQLQQLKNLVQSKKFSYFNLLNKNDKYKHLLQYVKKKTPLLQNKQYLISTRVYWVLNNLTNFPVCPICHKPYGMHLNIRIDVGYNKTCSKQCGRILSFHNQQKTNLEKYGCKCSLQNQEVKNKRKNTMLKKYGVQHPIQDIQIMKKIKQTNLMKYGCQNPMQNERIKKQAQNTLFKNYGVNVPSKNKMIFQKIKCTNLEKYGHENPMQNDEIKQKCKNINLEKYGCECFFNTQQSKQKTKMAKYKIGWNMILSWKDYIIPLFKQEEYSGHDKLYKWKCVKCGNQFEQRIYTTHNNDKFDSLPRCLRCYPILNGYSKSQKQILEFIKQIYDGKIIQNDKVQIKPYELDIYIPGKQLAIEYDGLVWHSDKFGKDNFYHLNKTERCEEKGIQLIHIFQDEWLNKKEIVKDKIKSLLGIYDKRIYARKCYIKQIISEQSNQFLNMNHVQGSDTSKIRYGLYYQNELVSVMTFGKPRFNKKYDFELIRYASKLGIQVIGGCSKLLKHFVSKYKSVSIISYADRRYSIGKLYNSTGFKLIGKSKPNYFYVKNQQKLTRYQCQKHKLKNVLGDKFNSELSETKNMELNGYYKIYDCGNLIFIKTN